MEIGYEYRFGLPRTFVLKYIKKEKVLKDALPKCKSISEKAAGYYLAELEINLGPIQDIVMLEIQLDEEKAPNFLHLKITGHGNMGQINGSAILLLEENQGGTKLTCKAKGQLTGALGLTGKRLLENGASKGLESFFQNLEKQIKRRIYELKKRSK